MKNTKLLNFQTLMVFCILSLGFSLFSSAADSKADAKDSAKPVEEQLENLNRLLDLAQYKEVETEWIRIAPLAQEVKLERKFAEQLTAFYARTIEKLLEAGEYRQALARWEQAVASHPQVEVGLGSGSHRDLIWELPGAYVKVNEHEKAIQLFKQFYYESPMPRNYEPPETVARRAQFGELLVYGKLGTNGKDRRIGRAQCALCHAFFEDDPIVRSSPPFGPHFFDFVPRTKLLITSPQYQHQPRKTEQPEAFSGSGLATSVIEYLAESMVCPNCFVVAGFGMKNTQDRESPMPTIHRPIIGLTVEEMIAINTWMFVNSGEAVPPLSEMQAAYHKFLPTEDRPDTPRALFLASLYDAKGDLVEALRLVEAHYPRVWRRQPEKTLLGYNLSQWRKKRDMFPHLKQRPDLLKKFPLLLQSQ